MSKLLYSCRKKWHQFGRNKDCHKILHDILNKWTVNKTEQGTGQDIYHPCTYYVIIYRGVGEWSEKDDLCLFPVLKISKNGSEGMAKE